VSRASTDPNPPPAIAVTRSAYAAGTWQPPHEHPFASVTLVLAGSVTETVGGRTEDAGPLSVVVKPPRVRHSDRIGPRGARTLSLILSADEHAGLLRAGVPLDGWRWIHGGPPARALLGLAHARGAPAAAYDALALACAPLPPSNGAPCWLARIRERIDDGPAVVRVRDLASEAGVHPVYLARRFRHHYGCAVVAYIRRRRAREAAALIADSGLGLSDIAHRSGFSDHAHLSRDFKALVGVSPRVFRSQARGRPG
jgi:AraC family transcriptional regulator